MMFVIIRNAIEDSSTYSLESAVMNATVHGWLEGHIDGEDATRPVSPGVSTAIADMPEDFFPMPPFPTVDAAHKIVVATVQLFPAPELAIAAVAYAAAIAWKDGHAEGRACHGCSFRGREPALAREHRQGDARVEIVVPRHVAAESMAAFFGIKSRQRRRRGPR